VFNVVEALIQEDALLGQHLDDNGLEKIRIGIIKARGNSEAVPDYGTAPRGLHNGRVLQEDENDANPFGLGVEAPLG
jgi:hypothetical protein